MVQSNSTSPIDLGTLLINGNDAMLSNKSQSSTGNDIQSQLVSKNPVTNLTDDQANALASVIKAANKSHAEEAFQQMGHDNAATLVALHNITSPTMNSPDSSSNSTPSSTTQTQTTQQPQKQQSDNNYSYKPDNPLSAFFNMLGITPSPDSQVLLTQAQMNRQKISGQEPLQQKDIEQSALETQQKINQALTVPPTQAEKMQNAAAYAGYKTTALKDMLDNTDKAMAQQNEIMKNMQGYSSWFNKPFGAMPKEAQQAFKKLKQLQLERIAVSSELNKHQQLLASGGASKSPFIEGQIYTDAQGNKATYKNGKFQ